LARKTGYDLWKEEQERLKSGEQFPAFVRQPKLNRVPSEKQSKAYRWEKNMLGEVSGNSYNNKFKKLMKSVGMTDEEEQKRFKNWLDRKEMNDESDRNLDFHFQDKAKEQAKKQEKLRQERQEELAEKKAKQDRVDNVLGKFTKIDKKFGEFLGSDRNIEEEVKNIKNKKASETERFVGRTVNEATFGIPEQIAKKMGDEKTLEEYYSDRGFGEGGGKDTIADILGFLAPTSVAYKTIRAAGMGMKAGSKGLTKVGQLAKEGAIAGAGVSGVNVGAKELLNPDDQSWKDNLKQVGTEASIGAIADPALYGLGKGAGRIIEKLRGGKAPEIVAQEEGISVEQVMEIMNQPTRVQGMNNPIPQIPPLPKTEPKFGELDYGQTPEVGNDLDYLFAPKRNLKSEMDEALISFGQQGRNTPKARQSTPIASNSEKWHDEITSFNKWIDESGYDRNRMTKEGLEEAWSQFARYEDSIPLEQAIDLAYSGPDGVKGFNRSQQYAEPIQPREANLKELLQKDERVNRLARQLFGNRPQQQPKNPLDTVTGQPNVDELDEMLNLLGQGQPNQNQEYLDVLYRYLNDVESKGIEGKPKQDLIDEILKNGGLPPKLEVTQIGGDLQPTIKAGDNSLSEPLVKNGQGMEKIEPASLDMDGSLKRVQLPKSNTKVDDDFVSDSLINRSQSSETLKPVDAVKNPVLKTWHKFRESYFNHRQQLSLADGQVTKKALEKAKDEGNTEEVKKLTQRLKDVKKQGSQVEMANANEEVANQVVEGMLGKHFDTMQNTLKKGNVEIKDALHYQMAKNIDYIVKNVDPDYALPRGWSHNRIQEIITKNDNNPTLQEFSSQFKGYMDELRQFMVDSGIKSKEEVGLLAKNEHYVPMYRDQSYKDGNIDKSLRGKNSKTNALLNLYSLDGGNNFDYFKNPLESIADLTDYVVKQGYRNDTVKELSKLADLDVDGMFVKRVRKRGEANVIGMENGEEVYLQVHQDMKDIMDLANQVENGGTTTAKWLGGLTRLYAGLKTRTLPHQLVATPRDLVMGYINSDMGVKDTFRYLGEFAHAIKTMNADAKKVGAYFEGAYNTHTGGVENHHKMVDDFIKQNGGKMTRLELMKSGAKKTKNALDKTVFLPARVLGQMSDSIPRNIEVRNVERQYADRIKKAEDELASLPPETDFEPEELMNKRQELMNLVQELPNQMKREMTYKGRDMMNYQRTGRSNFIRKFVKPYIIFANTTTQSKDKFFRQLKKDPLNTLGKVGVVTSPLIAAQQVAYHSADEETKQTMDQAPDYVKNYYWMFPQDNGSVTLVPKPHEAVPIISAFEGMFGKNKYQSGSDFNAYAQSIVKEFTPYQLGGIAQGLVPDRYGEMGVENMALPSMATTPFANTIVNDKTNFNRKPVSYGAKYGQDEASKYTSPLAKSIAGDNPNADRLEYLIGDLLGDYGRSAISTSNSEDPVMNLLKSLTFGKLNRDFYRDKEKEELYNK
jgi:hypothetical protein